MGTLGKHWKLSEESKQKMRKPKGVRSEAHRRNLGLALLGKNKGKKKPPRSAEHKAKLAPTMFKKGRVAHNKGIKGVVKLWPNGRIVSAEWRANMSKARMGKYTGASHPNWKGGNRPENTLIRESSAYLQWRRSVFTRDDFTCQDCGQRGGDLEAHHDLPFAHFPALRLEILNGVTLCVECHRKTFIHHKELAYA